MTTGRINQVAPRRSYIYSNAAAGFLHTAEFFYRNLCTVFLRTASSGRSGRCSARATASRSSPYLFCSGKIETSSHCALCHRRPKGTSGRALTPDILQCLTRRPAPRQTYTTVAAFVCSRVCVLRREIVTSLSTYKLSV